ncbi:MAG: YvcK family protein [Chloroflexota bacterium]|nr:YvcK family protein [Chloroflexota bacterium]
MDGGSRAVNGRGRAGRESRLARELALAGRARPEGRMARLRRWLEPGMGLKRWLLVVFLGELCLAAAGALLVRQVYRELGTEGPGEPLFYLLTLQFFPGISRILVLLGAGAALFLFGSWRLLTALLEPFTRREPLVELIYQKRSLARGPRVVAMGGGTGLSTLLRGLKQVTSNITAIVTVADDGGSSGKLRDELGIAPVGDIRNCIAALADAEPAMTRLLQYRFPSQTPAHAGLSGHSFGNLLIAALSAVEGDFEEGVRQSNRVLAVRGQVLPVAPVPLTLHAERADGTILDGQSVITRSTGIRRVWITPADIRASAEAVKAIAEADVIVLGPGSLYTSVLPSLLVPEIREALLSAAALRVYVCNVATQVGETEGYTLGDHLEALAAHGAGELLDLVLANDNFLANAPENYPAAPVRIDAPPPTVGSAGLVLRDVVDDANAHHHDPVKLAAALLEILAEHGASRRMLSVARTA